MTSVLTEPIRSDRGASGTRTLARVATYDQAERLVDRLSDAGFPVERVRIVGVDLYSVEQVTGRMTIGRAALAGAATGAGFGLLVGLVFGVFSLSAGWPLKTATVLRAANVAIAARVSMVAEPRCGINTTLSRSARPGASCGSCS